MHNPYQGARHGEHTRSEGVRQVGHGVPRIMRKACHVCVVGESVIGFFELPPTNIFSWVPYCMEPLGPLLYEALGSLVGV